ncbi:hypothetical protein [Nocardia rhizosphaerae]|uniref:Uncharacterized protein n=1 Tax=Nocardia rhizosphaerae TaxID=1691571 RepID=A0ABV8L561_9NOCA
MSSSPSLPPHWVGFLAFSLLRRAPFVGEPLVEYGVPQDWWMPLGLARAAGALGRGLAA